MLIGVINLLAKCYSLNKTFQVACSVRSMILYYVLLECAVASNYIY